MGVREVQDGKPWLSLLEEQETWYKGSPGEALLCGGWHPLKFREGGKEGEGERERERERSYTCSQVYNVVYVHDIVLCRYSVLPVE